MPETVQRVINGIYTLLRRPSDIKLPPDDVLELLNDDLKGRVQDLDLGGRDLRAETVLATIVEAEDVDYVITVPDVPDFEPRRLEYGLPDSTLQPWWEAQIVTPDSWSNQFDSDRVVASFYGSTSLTEGMKVRLNVNPTVLGEYSWRLTYRLPLLAIVQTGDRPPIPTNFLPMVKLSVAIKAIPIVNDDSEGWAAWMKRSLDIYAANLLKWEERWEQYVHSSVEPATQPIRPYNFFRQRRIRNTRASFPTQ